MLHGVTVRSPHASARIRSIDVSSAATAPGVHAVLTADDVPGRPTFGLEYADQPVLASQVVRYEGEPVALVAADTLEQAHRAAELVDIDYEPLPIVGDMEDALRGDAPQLHEHGNVLRHVHIESGDPDTAEADVWVERYYETAMQDQAALGPEGGLARPTGDGGVELCATTQWLHVDLQQIAPCLDLPEDRVRISLAGVGGAFGSREDIHVQIHACLLALRTGRPVKMTYGREESFHGHVHRHPSRTWIRYGATADGKLVAADVRLLLDGGAYASSSPAVLANASTFAAGPYEVPNVRIEGTVVYTNNPPCGAMRGFGAPQVCFAHESAMDALAARLEIDPVELRLRNALRTGSVLPTGQVLTGQRPAPRGDRALCGDSAPTRSRRPITCDAASVSRLGFKNVAYSEGFDDSAEASVTLTAGRDGAAGRGSHGRGRLRPGAVHGARADRRARSSGVEHGSPSRPADTADDRVGRVDLGVAPDDDGRRRGSSGGVPRDSAAALDARRPDGLWGIDRGSNRSTRTVDVPPPADDRVRR